MDSHRTLGSLIGTTAGILLALAACLHLANPSYAVEAEKAGVLTVVSEIEALEDAVDSAMTHSREATAFHAENQGASARILSAIRPALEKET